MKTIMGLITISLLVSVWAITSDYERKRAEEGVGNMILEYEKLIFELENQPPVECVSTRPYTYDQWVTSKPCPPGKRGPLCHMDQTDYE